MILLSTRPFGTRGPMFYAKWGKRFFPKEPKSGLFFNWGGIQGVGTTHFLGWARRFLGHPGGLWDFGL